MRHLLHKAICWYLRRCGGAFHCYNYGAAGRYVQLMTETQYAQYATRCNTGTEVKAPFHYLPTSDIDEVAKPVR